MLIYYDIMTYFKYQKYRKKSFTEHKAIALLWFHWHIIVLFLIIVNLLFFRFKNHQQWWQQARASSTENEKDNVVEGEKCNEHISGKSEDPVAEQEKHTTHPAKRRKVSL